MVAASLYNQGGHIQGHCHEDALFLFQMKTAEATTHVAAPSARYKFMLSYPPSSSFFGNADDGCVAHSASYTWSARIHHVEFWSVTYMDEQLRYAAPRRTDVQGRSHAQRARVLIRLLFASLHRLVLVCLQSCVYCRQCVQVRILLP